MTALKAADIDRFVARPSPDQPIVLFPNEWTMRYFVEKNPELKLHDLPLEQTR